MEAMRTALGLLSIVGVAACSEAASDDAKVTYERELRPLIEQNCTSCHKQGGIGPFALDQWPIVEQYRELIVGAVSSGRMPPWPVDPTCQPLRDVRLLSDASRSTFVRWGDDGYVRGDPADYRPPAETVRVDLGEPALLLEPAEPYVPTSGVTDEYRCFLADGAFDAATYVTAMDIRPGNRRTVHHVQMHVIPGSSIAEAQALDAAATGPGYPCVRVTGSYNMFSWRPGSDVVRFEPGDAGLVDAGSRIELEIHYNMEHLDRGELPEPDLTELALWTLPAGELPDRIVRRRGITAVSLDIPAGESHYVAEQGWPGSFVGGVGTQSVAVPVEMVGQTPHMHALGTRLSVWKADETGSGTCLIDVPRWDFHWQLDYAYASDTAVPLAAGDQLTVRCEYDNSEENQQEDVGGQKRAPRRVTWGEGTSDEMCLNYVWLRYDRKAYLEAPK